MIRHKEMSAIEHHLREVLNLIRCNGKDARTYVPSYNKHDYIDSPVALILYPVGWEFTVVLKVCHQRFELNGAASVLAITPQILHDLEHQAIESEFAIAAQLESINKHVKKLFGDAASLVVR